MQFEYKKLPKHWRYVLTKRDVKKLISEIDADIRIIEFLGTGSKPSKIMPGLYSAGNMEARASEDRWRYQLRFWGLPEKVIISDQKEISANFIDDIKEFVETCHKIPVNSKPSPLDRKFSLKQTQESLSPRFYTKKIEGFWEKFENANTWWI